MLQRYIDGLLKHHKAIAFVSVFFILVLAAGLPKSTITTDFRVYFSEDNPQLAVFENLEQTFNKQDNLFFLIIPKERDVFTKDMLTLVWELSEKSWQTPYSRRVSSITNFQHTYAEGDDLTTEFLVDDPVLLNKETIARIRQIALNEPILKNLLHINGEVTAVNVLIDLPVDNIKANNEVLEYGQQLVSDIKYRYPGVTILLSGAVASNVSLGQAVEQDLETLTVWSYLLIILSMLVLLRSVAGMIATLIVITLSVSGTFGLFGWLDYVLSPVAGFVPSIVMTIAVADSIHIIISFFFSLRQGMSQHEAVRESMRINASPVFVTSVTTIIGVLCLNFSDSPPYRDLGNMVAVGVFLAYFLSMTLLPAILAWMPISKKHAQRSENKAMDKFALWVVAHHRILLFGIGTLVIVLTSFIGRNELTERWHDYFDDSFEIRQAVNLTNEKLTGVHAIRYMLDTGRENGINDPAYLQALADFSDWYREQPGVGYVNGLSATIKRLNKNMHGDDASWYQIPESRDLVAQYLLLYELSLPLGLGLDNTINMDRSATQFFAIVKKTDSEFLLDLDNRAQQWLQQNAPMIKPTSGSGLDMIFAHITHRNIRSMLAGTAIALVLISFVLIIALRSVRLGLISLLPNLAPAALAYGTWGLLNGRIDMSASVVICMSLGIVVDDTVHFLSKYLRARREQNLNTVEGMRYAFRTVGVALTITTFVLSAGFMVLAASHFSPTWIAGLLLSMTLLYALLVDFLLLPPLLMVLDRHAYRKNRV